jgi:hypothetical protein
MDAFNWLMAAVSTVIGLAGGLCVVTLPILILAGLGVFLYRQSRRAGAMRTAAQDWSQTQGTVLASTIQVRRTGRSRSEIPVVLYQYEVGGKMFQGKTIRVGEGYFNVRVAGQAQAIVARYPAGARATVYYDPANPAASALER